MLISLSQDDPCKKRQLVNSLQAASTDEYKKQASSKQLAQHILVVLGRIIALIRTYVCVPPETLYRVERNNWSFSAI